MFSLCMIVKDEEKYLATAINSASGLANEVIIIDTGSTDKTVEIARDLGALVTEGGDRMNKAESRNRGIDAATGEWIIILDADEQIADPIGLRTFLATTEAQAVFIRLVYMTADDRPTLAFPQMRCWRKGAFRYKYRAHEVPLPENGWGKLAYTDFVWEHRQPPDRAWKSTYTLNRLLLDVQENPGDPRPLYYLGRQYMYTGEWATSIKILEQYIATDGCTDRANAWHCLSQCYSRLNDETRQIEALYQACTSEPTRRDWWCILAGIYHKHGQNSLATGLLKCALELPSLDRSYTNYHWFGPGPHDLLARCLWKLGRYEEGRENAARALSMAPANNRLRRNLLWFEAQLGSMDAFYELHGPNIHSGCARHQAIAELVAGPRVLDIGCGTGDLLLILQERFPDWELTGTDISPVALDMAAERGVKAKLILTGEIPSGRWDTIVMSQVLEHVEDDAAMVEFARQHLQNDGKLIVSVPKGDQVPAPDHKRKYCEGSLAALLSVLGQPRLHSWVGEGSRIIMVVKRDDG